MAHPLGARKGQHPWNNTSRNATRCAPPWWVCLGRGWKNSWGQQWQSSNVLPEACLNQKELLVRMAFENSMHYKSELCKQTGHNQGVGIINSGNYKFKLPLETCFCDGWPSQFAESLSLPFGPRVMFSCTCPNTLIFFQELLLVVV